MNAMQVACVGHISTIFGANAQKCGFIFVDENRILKQHESRVSVLAAKFSDPGSSLFDDLKQEGLLALLLCSRRWSADVGLADPTRGEGVTLWEFAKKRVRGAMINFLVREGKEPSSFVFADDADDEADSPDNEARPSSPFHDSIEEECGEELLAPSPEDLFLLRERNHLVRTAIANLSPEDRSLLQAWLETGDGQRPSAEKVGEKFHASKSSALRRLRSVFASIKKAVDNA